MASREEQENQRRLQRLASQARKTETGGKAPRMRTSTAPRDIKEGAKRKEFTVAPNCSFFDEDGVKRRGGDKVELSQKMAKYLNDLGFIAHDIEDFDDDDDTSNSGDTSKAAKGSGDNGQSGDAQASGGDKEEGGTKASSDTDGKGSGGGSTKASADEASGGNDSKSGGARKL